SGTVAAVRQEIDRLTKAGGSPFWDKYSPLLQTDTDVVMAHGRLRRAINALPSTSEGLHERKEWSAPRVHAKRSRRTSSPPPPLRPPRPSRLRLFPPSPHPPSAH